MIIIECTWCEAELVLDNIDATSVDCADCRITVDLVTDPERIAIAA